MIKMKKITPEYISKNIVYYEQTIQALKKYFERKLDEWEKDKRPFRPLSFDYYKDLYGKHGFSFFSYIKDDEYERWLKLSQEDKDLMIKALNFFIAFNHLSIEEREFLKNVKEIMKNIDISVKYYEVQDDIIDYEWDFKDHGIIYDFHIHIDELKAFNKIYKDVNIVNENELFTYKYISNKNKNGVSFTPYDMDHISTETLVMLYVSIKIIEEKLGEHYKNIYTKIKDFDDLYNMLGVLGGLP
jgi:hypothetical protein